MGNNVFKRVLSLLAIVGILFGGNIQTMAKEVNRDVISEEVPILNSEEQDIFEQMIYAYEDTVNNKKLDEYINLFDTQTQLWMWECAASDDFFLGEKVTINRIKRLSAKTGDEAADITRGEFGERPYIVYYVEAYCDTTDVTNENIKALNGNILYAFVFVKENNEWKIGRVSIADSIKVIGRDEGFGDKIEKKIYANEVISILKAPLSEPATICIKMTKSENKKYWGKDYVTLNFKDYILNVVPNEFVVSTGGEYLKAGTMVVKMFGWYNTLHKKYPNSPGGCDLQDTSADQNYLAGSYNALGIYKSRLDDAYSAIKGKALVDSNNNVFLTQYRAGTTDSTVGQLGEKTAAELSKAGKKYLEILQNAYDNSSNANKTTVKIVSY